MSADSINWTATPTPRTEGCIVDDANDPYKYQDPNVFTVSLHPGWS